MATARIMGQRARTLSAALALSPPFEPDTFVEAYAQDHGLMITIVPFPMALTTTGFVLRLSDINFTIFHDRFLSPALRARTIYHEVAHVILDHVRTSSPDDLDRLFEWPPRVLRHNGMLRGRRFALAHEIDAEALGTALTLYSFTSAQFEPLVVEEQDYGKTASDFGRYLDAISF